MNRRSKMVHMHVSAWVMVTLGLAGAGCVASPPPETPARTPARPQPTTAAPFTSAGVIAASDGTAVFHDVRFADGRVLDEVRIHYATAGTPRRDDRGRIVNAVLMLHWTGSSSDVLQGRAFADALYAPGKPLDLARHYLVFIDALGHGRSSKPSDGMRARFPSYGYEDIVGLQHRTVTEALGLDHLHAIVGLSMGGMNAWQWAVRYPNFMDAIIPIVALPARISGRNLIWRRFVALHIRKDPTWADGNYTSPPRGWTEAFPVFRMMLDGVPHLHETVPDRDAADAFVRDASAQAARMDANDILYALEASRDYDPSPALERIRARVFALNFADDEFNPVALGILESSMRRVSRGKYVIQPGTSASFGHFTQAHPELWAPRMSAFLAELEGDTP
ncbi:MAG TPA: alpha/beta fold hydrolase [Polyangium sp.]|nr:alpha/beta fold hydrolase [Polyangium sp.]